MILSPALTAIVLLLQAEAPGLIDRLHAADDPAAIRIVSAEREATRDALVQLLTRFDGSVHSDRQRPEQRRVQYDADALSLGLRISDLYARVTGDREYRRRFHARELRIEGTRLLNDRRYRDAIARLTAALREAEALRDRWLETITLVNLAYGYLETGQPQRALDACERANHVAAGLDDKARALTAFNLGSVHLHVGKYARSIEFSREAIEISRRVGIRLWHGNGELNLAAAYRYLDQLGEARAALERGLDVLTASGDRLGIGRTLYNLALVANDQRNYSDSARYAERALPIIREVDIRHSHEIELDPNEYTNPLEVSALELLVSAYTNMGEAENAAAHAAALREARARGGKKK